MLNYSWVFVRKLRSLSARMSSWFFTMLCYLNVFGNPSISIASNCSFGRGVSLRATDGGSITLGRGVSLADHVQIVTQGGRVIVGNDVFIGVGSIIVSRESIEIGRDALIAEYVVIRDQDHRTDSRPIRLSGFHTSPVRIGTDVWIGSKASILRSAFVGDRSVIGAHAVVKSLIPNDSLAVGVPARVVKQLKSSQ